MIPKQRKVEEWRLPGNLTKNRESIAHNNLFYRDKQGRGSSNKIETQFNEEQSCKCHFITWGIFCWLEASHWRGNYKEWNTWKWRSLGEHLITSHQNWRPKFKYCFWIKIPTFKNIDSPQISNILDLITPKITFFLEIDKILLKSVWKLIM